MTKERRKKAIQSWSLYSYSSIHTSVPYLSYFCRMYICCFNIFLRIFKSRNISDKGRFKFIYIVYYFLAYIPLKFYPSCTVFLYLFRCLFLSLIAIKMTFLATKSTTRIIPLQIKWNMLVCQKKEECFVCGFSSLFILFSFLYMLIHILRIHSYTHIHTCIHVYTNRSNEV